MPCPPPAQAVWIDTDGDGIVDYDDGTPPPGDPPPEELPPPDDPNMDSDGDGLTNAQEAAAGTNAHNPDSDGDGLSDFAEVTTTGTNPNSSDTDGDGISDYNEFYGNESVDEDEDGPGETPYDHDGDGIPDPEDPDPTSPENDPDSDGDSVPDSEDSHPSDPSLWNDDNGNGINDDAETPNSDTDGDGVSNDTDSHPSDPALYNDWNYNGVNDQDEDWDGDGVSNLQDSHPNSNVLWCDWNNNGINDDAEANLGDDDGDNVPNNADSHPLNSSLWEDWNNNGCNDSQEGINTDGDSAPDYLDSDPENPALWNDWNRNGTNDDQEPPPPDDDGDGHPNASDSHPDNNLLWSDWNNNGINDNEEPPPDDDGDGTPNSEDSHPGNIYLWDDWNFNGYNESTEDNYLDDDNDNHPNAFDSQPQDPSLWSDWNNNGINDEEDIVITDPDNDGYANSVDSHPQDGSRWNDHNDNGVNDELEAPPDSDADGLADHEDPFPNDQDNDGLTDTEEVSAGTLYDNPDTDGDGLKDGEEAYAGTNPLNVDTDGDGMTDFEELRGSFTNPLDPTNVVTGDDGGGEGDPLPPAGPEIVVEESLNGQVTSGYYIPDGAITVFPSKAVNTNDLVKTYTVHNVGDQPLTGLSVSLDGTHKTHFTLTAPAAPFLQVGATTTFTVTFKAPAAYAATSLTASVLLTSNDEDESSFDINLKSVSGFWHSNYQHFFANLHDADQDGLPDLVEELYASPAWDDYTSRTFLPPGGDLDGDGKTNYEEYLAGTYLKGTASTDYDQDGLDNTMEDNWSKVYSAHISKYRPNDAYADPDADGLLTIEELKGLWGPQKEDKAVATHPFNQASGPNSSAGVTYSVVPPAVRAHPLSSAPAYYWARRESTYKPWLTDALLREAIRDRVASGAMTAAAFFIPKYKYQLAPAEAGQVPGWDHLPAGYLAWLRSKGVTFPGSTDPDSGVLPAPSAAQAEVIAQLRARYERLGSDRDQDNLLDAWEIFHDLDWRKRFPPTLQVAQAEWDQEVALMSDAHGIRSIYAAVTFTAYDGGGGIINEYPVDPPAAPVATDTQQQYSAKRAQLLRWTTLNGMDPDHDGLSNHSELELGKNPIVPDFADTSGRDTDGDGYTDVQEVTAGSDPLKATSKLTPAVIVVEGGGQTVLLHQQLPNDIVVQSVYKGPTGGLCPAPGLEVEIAAPSNYTLLAKRGGAGQAISPDLWEPKVLRGPAGHDGLFRFSVMAPHTAVNFNLVTKVTRNGSASAPTYCLIKPVSPAGDSDGDGMPNTWEIQNSLGYTNALDAEVSPLHFGYHRSTPLSKLAAQDATDIQTAKDAQGVVMDYPTVNTTDSGITTKQWTMLSVIDPDHDKVCNLDEYRSGQHPKSATKLFLDNFDFDGDGFSDMEEAREGSNIFSANSKPALKLKLVAGGGQTVTAGEAMKVKIVVHASMGSKLESLPVRVSMSGSDTARAAGSGSWQSSLELTTNERGTVSFDVSAGSAAGENIMMISSSAGAASLEIPYTVAARATGGGTPPPTDPGALPPLGSPGRPYPNVPTVMAYTSETSGWANAYPVIATAVPHASGLYAAVYEERHLSETLTTSSADGTSDYSKHSESAIEHRMAHPVIWSSMTNEELSAGMIITGGSYSTSRFSYSDTFNTEEWGYSTTVGSHSEAQSTNGGPEISSGTGNSFRRSWTKQPDNSIEYWSNSLQYYPGDEGSFSGVYHSEPPSLTPTSILQITTGTPLSGQGSGSYYHSAYAEVRDPITAEDIFAGLQSDFNSAQWSDWQRAHLSEQAITSSNIYKTDTSAGGGVAKWRLSYELPEGADAAQLSPAVVVITRERWHDNAMVEQTVERVNVEPGKDTEIFDCNASSTPNSTLFIKAQVEHVPFEIQSLDRYVEVTLPGDVVTQFGGEANCKVRFQNNVGESYEVALANAKIYEEHVVTPAEAVDGMVEEGAFFPSSECQSDWNAADFNDATAPIAVSKKGGSYKFVTCFNHLGPITVMVSQGNQPDHVVSRNYTLSPNKDMADLMASLENTFRESHYWSGIGIYEPTLANLPPLPAPFVFPDDNPPILLAGAPPPPPPGQAAASGSGTGWGFSFRNLVAKCCSTVYETVKSTVVQGVVLQVEAVKIAVIGAQGFVAGFWAACKSDYKELTELAEMIAHPAQAAKSLYEGFRGLCSMSMAQIKSIPAQMLKEFLGDAMQDMAWVDPSGPDGLDLIIYTTGYGAGYLAEQIIKSIVLGAFALVANIVRTAVMGSKIAQTMKALKVGQKILGGVAAGKEVMARITKAKNLVMRTATQWVKSKTGMNALEEMARRTLQAGCTN